ncbi:hypothetical protein M9H77_29453 [Catharanthus roseus]|uniref:Uncharacterized protein n=1 Tax=Catharanthus roseus TaxID=4058 RepID=A0ACB9ZVC3_CATRO|nr:hypothetical protein M9H77_29453 [Catharanthus roseus]
MEAMIGMLTEEATTEIDITPIGIKWVFVTSLLVLKLFFISLMKIVVRIVLIMFIKDDTSFVDSNIVSFEVDCALFDFLHDEYLGKFIEDIDYVFPFLDALRKNFVRVTRLNQRLHLLSSPVEFSYNEHNLSSVVDSSNLLFENTFGFKCYHLHCKDFLLKGFGINVRVGLDTLARILLFSSLLPFPFQGVVFKVVHYTC